MDDMDPLAALDRLNAEQGQAGQKRGGRRGDDADIPQRERIIDAVQAAGALFWRDADSVAYVTLPIDVTQPDGAVAHYAVRSSRFKNIVRQLYGRANKVSGPRGIRPGSCSDAALNEAIPALEAVAMATAAVHEAAVRLTENRGAIWIDIGDDTFAALRVTAEAWEIVRRASAPLVRPNGLRALPAPVADPQAVGRLRRLVNLPDDGQDAAVDGVQPEGKRAFMLLVGWLVAALYPTGPYAVLAVDGEQGSGKSTICRMLRRLVDPNKADLRAPPRNEDDLLIAASNSRVVALDNMSFIDAETADALARLATGAGLSKRALYTNGEEHLVALARPILLNGIPSLLGRADLADRAIAITLPPIPDTARKPEAQVWREFDAAAPGILAALLDGLVMALRRLPTLNLPSLPRMADFARIACAAAPAFGWTDAEMLTALRLNRETAVEAVLDADPLAVAVQGIVADRRSEWLGTATTLLTEVNQVVSLDIQRERGWPKNAARLGERLRRVAPALRRAGVDVLTTREGRDRERRITIKRVSLPARPDVGEPPSALSAPSADMPTHGRYSKTDRTEPADGADRPPATRGTSPSASTARKTHDADGADSADSELQVSGCAPWAEGEL